MFAHVGTAHSRDHRFHHVVLALTALVGVYCSNEVFGVQPTRLGMPGVLLIPPSPWHPPQLAACVFCPLEPDRAWLERLSPRRYTGLWRIEARVISGHFDQRIVAQKLDGAVHRFVAAGPGLIGRKSR